MGVFDRFRGSKARDDVPTLEATLEQCPSGDVLLQIARKHNARISIVPDSELQSRPFETTLGQLTVHQENVEVAINAQQSRARKVTTLAHELEHLSQIQSGQYRDVTSVGENEYIANGLDNEAKAETAANRVAHELRERGIYEPAKEKDRDAEPQWMLYSSLRGSGYPHEFSASQSEELWSSNSQRLSSYTEKLEVEWVEANQTNVAKKDLSSAKPNEGQQKTEVTTHKSGLDRNRNWLEQATLRRGPKLKPRSRHRLQLSRLDKVASSGKSRVGLQGCSRRSANRHRHHNHQGTSSMSASATLPPSRRVGRAKLNQPISAHARKRVYLIASREGSSPTGWDCPAGPVSQPGWRIEPDQPQADAPTPQVIPACDRVAQPLLLTSSAMHSRRTANLTRQLHCRLDRLDHRTVGKAYRSVPAQEVEWSVSEPSQLCSPLG